MSAEHSESPERRATPARLLCVVVLVPAAVAGLWWLGNVGHRVWAADKAEEFKQACLQHSDNEDWPQLEAEAQRWLEWDDTDPDAWLYFADARLQQNDPVAAVDALRRVPDSSDKAIPSLLLASELQLGAANRPLDVVQTLEHLLKLRPDSTTAHQRIIFFNAITLQYSRMRDAIRSAISYGSEPPEVYTYLVIAGDLRLTNGFMLTDRWIQSDPENELLVIARAVQYALLMDRLESSDVEPSAQVLEREERMRELLERYPHSAALLRYHLHIAASEENLDQVGRLLAQVNDETGHDSVIWRYRGWYHARHDALDDAERAYRRSLELDRLDWRTWHELAAVLRRLGRLDEAEQVQRISLEGKDLQKELLQLPDVAAVTIPLLERIRNYASHCGADFVVQGIESRLGQGQSPAAAEVP